MLSEQKETNQKLRIKYKLLIEYLEEATGGNVMDDDLCKIEATEKLANLINSDINNKFLNFSSSEYLAHLLVLNCMKTAIIVDGEIRRSPDIELERIINNFEKAGELLKAAKPIAKAAMAGMMKELRNDIEENKNSQPLEKSSNDKKIEAFEAKLIKPFYDATEAGKLLNGTTRQTVSNWMSEGTANYEWSGSRKKLAKEEMIRLYKKKILKIL